MSPGRARRGEGDGEDGCATGLGPGKASDPEEPESEDLPAGWIRGALVEWGEAEVRRHGALRPFPWRRGIPKLPRTEVPDVCCGMF